MNDNSKPRSLKTKLESKCFLTVNELSEYLGVSPKTIYGWIYRGILNPIRIGPRLVRFDIKDIERWVSKRGDSKYGN